MSNPIKDYLENRKEKQRDFARRNPKNKRTKMNLLFNVLAGGYLLYTVYEIIKEKGWEDIETPALRVLFYISIVLFAVVGVYVIIRAALDYKNRNYFDPSTDDFSEDAEEPVPDEDKDYIKEIETDDDSSKAEESEDENKGDEK